MSGAYVQSKSSHDSRVTNDGQLWFGSWELNMDPLDQHLVLLAIGQYLWDRYWEYMCILYFHWEDLKEFPLTLGLEYAS